MTGQPAQVQRHPFTTTPTSVVDFGDACMYSIPDGTHGSPCGEAQADTVHEGLLPVVEPDAEPTGLPILPVPGTAARERVDELTTFSEELSELALNTTDDAAAARLVHIAASLRSLPAALAADSSADAVPAGGCNTCRRTERMGDPWTGDSCTDPSHTTGPAPTSPDVQPDVEHAPPVDAPAVLLEAMEELDRLGDMHWQRAKPLNRVIDGFRIWAQARADELTVRRPCPYGCTGGHTDYEYGDTHRNPEGGP